MGLQLKGNNGSESDRRNPNSSNAFGIGDKGQTQEVSEVHMSEGNGTNAAKEAIAKKQEEMRQKALAFEQMEVMKRQREQKKREEEMMRNNPELAAEMERRFAAERAAEEQRSKFIAEEQAKIDAEKRVQEKKMDQTEALIAAIRAQVEKEKAAKAATTQKTSSSTSSNKQSSTSENKPHYRTISPEEMARLEEKKRLKAEGVNVDDIKPEESVVVQESPEVKSEESVADSKPDIDMTLGVSGGLNGLQSGPTLTNQIGDGPTLSNMNVGQPTLNNMSMNGGGLGIDITASMDKQKDAFNADANTVALNIDELNDAIEKTKPVLGLGESSAQSDKIKLSFAQPKVDDLSSQGIGTTSTIVVDGNNTWNQSETDNVTTIEESATWVSSETSQVQMNEQTINKEVVKDSFLDDNGDLISVVPVRQKPIASNDVQSAYNIDFDDDDDDEISFVSPLQSEENKAEEEAKRKAEEEARRKAEEAAARRKAEEEAKRKAEEEARREAEEEAKRRAEEEARRQAEEEAKRRAEEEAKRKAEEEARRQAEEEAKRRAEEEARRRAEEEAKRKAEEEARRRAEEEAKRKAEEEARRQAEEEARRRAEEEAKRKAEEEARRQAEEEAKRKAEEEARRQAEEEAKRKAEEEARRRAEEEAKRQAEEERRRAEEEAKRKAEEEARRQAELNNTSRGQVLNHGFTLPIGAEQFLGKYLSVNAINDQIANTMEMISQNPNEPRNIVILGQYGFGTTTIAEDFARSYYAMGLCKTKTIAKIKAGALNRANISDAISKLQGGCLVVENAGVISNEKLDEIYQIVSDPNNDVVIIMTGQIETLSRIFKDNVVISTQFKHLIQVHRITDMDVFTIAKNHAMQLGYPCEESAEMNLRKRMQEVESGNLDRVLKIVDNAVSKAHNREMLTGDQEHRLVPADFE